MTMAMAFAASSTTRGMGDTSRPSSTRCSRSATYDRPTPSTAVNARVTHMRPPVKRVRSSSRVPKPNCMMVSVTTANSTMATTVSLVRSSSRRSLRTRPPS